MKTTQPKNYPTRRTPVGPHSEIDDNQLYRAIRDGDQAAFGQFYVRAIDTVVRFIKAIVGSEEEAKEIAQDVFASIWENRHRIEPDKKLESYIFTASRNSAFKLLKRRQTHSKFHTEQINISSGLEAAADDSVISKETEILIKHVLRMMPAQRRKVFEMSRLEGLSHDEIAMRLNISRHTVNRHITLALKDLRTAVTYLVIIIFLK